MIKAAGVKVHFLPYESIEDEVIYIVQHHSQCIKQLLMAGLIKDKDFEIIEEGFLTEKCEFLDRRSAADHAYACGQLVEDAETERIEVLMSEDLW